MIFQWKSFLIDLPSLEVWLKSQFPSFIGLRGTSTLAIRFAVAMTPEQKATVQEHLDALTESGEAAKRALPSRKRGATGKLKEQIDFENAVKAFISTKSLTELSVAERKLFMGAQLSNTEYDTLTTS